MMIKKLEEAVNHKNNACGQNVEDMPKRIKIINNLINEYWER